MRLYAAGDYLRAREAFHSAAALAGREGSLRRAAVDWNNAGGAALARLDYRNSLTDFLMARKMAERYGLSGPRLMVLTNLATLYLQMDDPKAALRVADEALAAARGTKDIVTLAKARYQQATALTRVNRFEEAEPIYRESIAEIEQQGDIEGTARIMTVLGFQYLEAGRLDKAEALLVESLRLARLHQLNTAANTLRALAKLKARQGDGRSAEALFDAAIEAPPGVTPRWLIYLDRGEFRLGRNDLRGALADFRKARGIASRMRADIVPADQARVALENGLDRIDAGLIDAGNRLARQTGDPALLRETFDAAEQDRRWSLRALDPGVSDWRNHLPDSYWDVLARYQTVETSMMANPAPELTRRSSLMERDLEEMEAAAGRTSHEGTAKSPLAHVVRLLAPGTVLFSFHIGPAQGWLWAVDAKGVAVYPLPPSAVIREAVTQFAAAVQTGDDVAVARGRHLYDLLFGRASSRFVLAKRWLLDLDGPLFNLPFAALPVGNRKNKPVFLLERAVVETIPSALMLEPAASFGNGEFLGIGDPIYNAADDRYRGERNHPAVALPRLAATASEVQACARAWKPTGARILTGAEADLDSVRSALRSNPAVIHFATHVVEGPGSHSSGLIALSLDRSGAMGFLGPKEIVAHAASPRLIVLNGCHSAQGEALPGTGLMGLTRAWIGAGAHAVIATRWDIPDETGAAIMVAFYRALRAEPGRGPAYALQQAQEEYLKSEDLRGNTRVKALAVGAAYFLLGRG